MLGASVCVSWGRHHEQGVVEREHRVHRREPPDKDSHQPATHRGWLIMRLIIGMVTDGRYTTPILGGFSSIRLQA